MVPITKAVTEIQIPSRPVYFAKRYCITIKKVAKLINCKINAFTFKDMLSKEERNVQKDIYDIKKLFAKENIITNMRK